MLHLVELVESHFKKSEVPVGIQQDEGGEVPNTNVQIQTRYVHEEPYIWVFVTAKLTSTSQGQETLSAEVTMKGLFERKGETALGFENFGQVNGPAIVFPFVREQLATLTMKANLPPILLQPINFVKRSDKAPDE